MTTKGPSQSAHAIMESVVGCKWSLQILAQIRQGNLRPGSINRSIEGLSTKVMNERLSKLSRFGILRREVFPEVPPRVEYQFTEFGRRFTKILDDLEQLDASPLREGTASS